MTKRGEELLNDPILNRGTGFSLSERDQLGLHGLLPARVETLEQQVDRVVENCSAKPTDLERYIFLMALQDQNETLFYRTILKRLKDYMPIIYTPTVGEAALKYGAIFRRPRGLYITADDRGRVEAVLRNWADRDPRVIVATDGGRVLGLGDLGANGMTISIGKLALYTAVGGIPPAATLPIVVDVGTDNEELHASPFYLGLRRPRLTQTPYLELMDEFVEAVQRVFPQTMLQFEDFSTDNAIALLERYRNDMCTFNDDIQGTAGVTLAGLIAALRVTGGKLKEQTLLFVGAGSANIGIADLLAGAIADEGMDLAEARRRCWFMDSKGLIVAGRDRVKPHALSYAHEHEPVTGIAEAIEALSPTVLIGATGQRGIFSREVIEAMSRAHDRPVVFALSNPTSRSEATAEDVYGWSGGRAVFASGSPFDPLTVEGRTFVPGQSNNVYIFPGIGLGVMACHIRRVTDRMFRVAAQAVADAVTEANLSQGSLFPELERIREVSLEIAVAISRLAFEQGLSGIDEPPDLRQHIAACMYEPSYESGALVSQ
jgi:malate dehydrogenase (oxaloacetate-decarboxylating)(NADP+)